MSSETPHVYRLPLSIDIPAAALRAMEAIRGTMRALVVGGGVRDAILGIVPKDIDIEVYGGSYDDLVTALARHGETNLVGRAFGVIKFREGEGNEVDFSIPRRESRTGVGHKDFATFFDPTISPRDAAARRDFTMNALAWDPFTEELHDYFGGVADLRAGILRATSPAFSEDALRVLRGMQFCARFDLRIEAETGRLCSLLFDDYRHLARERIGEEWMKLAIRGRSPGRLWPYLVETGWIAHHPLLERLLDVPQDVEWHPEGSVDRHTGLVMDAMARIAEREGIAGDDRAVLMFAALTHDLAKAHFADGGTTLLRDKAGTLRWTSYGHEQAGGPLAAEFLGSIGIKAEIIDRVVPLVENHLAHVHLTAGGVIERAGLRRLADRLAPATIRELVLLIEADQSGRPPLPGGLPQAAQQMLDLAMAEGIAGGPPPRLVQGRDVLPYYKGNSGPHIGAAVAAAYQAYLAGAFSDREGAAAWLSGYLADRIAIIRGRDVVPYLDGPGPAVGAAVRAAWEAQAAGIFSDRAGAESWLRRYFGR